MSMLQRGAQWLADRRRESVSVRVTIRRGASSTANVPAGVGRSQDLREDGGGVIVNDETRDFKIAKGDYRLGGVAVAPREGDEITDVSSGASIRYLVLPITGEEAARWADPFGESWRIHTKRRNA
jgi:hypothetical protein